MKSYLVLMVLIFPLLAAGASAATVEQMTQFRHKQTHTFDQVMKTAKRGNAKAEYRVAMFYREGFGAPPSNAEYFAWMKRSAEHGNRNAQYNIGLAYLTGIGNKGSYSDGLSWLKKAALNGYILAQRALGNIYFYGQWDGRDYNFNINTSNTKGIYWLKSACLAGSPQACGSLGQAYVSMGNIPEARTFVAILRKKGTIGRVQAGDILVAIGDTLTRSDWSSSGYVYSAQAKAIYQEAAKLGSPRGVSRVALMNDIFWNQYVYLPLSILLFLIVLFIAII